MAATLASTSNTVNNTRQNTQMGNLPVSRGDTTYVRPADWLTLPTVTTSDEKFVGLIAVTNDSTNYVSITLTGTGGFAGTIDWGDGTSDTGILDNTTVTHVYNYATLSSTVSSRGYKMAIVTITVQSGIWNGFNISSPTPTAIAGPNSTSTYKWLDVAFSGQYLILMTCSGSTAQNRSSMLEQVNIVKVNTLQPGFLNGAATALQNVIFGVCTNRITNVSSMFSGCTSLVNVPDFTSMVSTTPGTINCTGLFNGCTSLQSVSNFTIKPLLTSIMFQSCSSLITAINLDLTLCTDASSMFLSCTSLTTTQSTFVFNGAASIASMFSTCSSLRVAPNIQGASINSVANIFDSCQSLVSAPGYSFPGVTTSTVGGMFQGCAALVEIGYLNFPNLISTATQMFTSCTSLQRIAGINFGANGPTGTVNMFQNCRVLKEFPFFNTSNASAMDGMFSGCTQLTTIPPYNTSNNTNFSSMFNNCYSLVTGPTLNLTKATNTTSMFQNCVNLVSVPTYNTSNVTIVTTMFNSCPNLKTVPLFDTSKATATVSTFQGCQKLTTVPTFNTSNSTSFNTMFSGCVNLAIAPPIDTTKAISVTGMFTNCYSLNSIPAYNFANVTAAVNTGFINLNALGNIQMTGLRQPHNIGACKLGKTELENYFANLVGIPAGSTALTITGNPGADTANAKTSGTTAGSNVVTMANTVGITANTFIYGTGINTGIPVTFADAGDTVVYTNGGGVNGLANGDNVLFTAITTTTGIVINTTYFVVNRTVTTFQVSATSGGSPLPLTTNGTGVMSIGGATLSNQVASVVANVSVTIRGVSGITNAAAALTARNLNTNYATTKNWSIVG